MNTASPILNRPIAELGFSREFRLVTEALGFHTLADMVGMPATHIAKLPGFTKRMLVEYIGFLEGEGLGGLIGK